MPYSKNHKQKVRRRILSTARQLFLRKGYAGTSINEIMCASDLTRGAFYAHFKSKRELYNLSLQGGECGEDTDGLIDTVIAWVNQLVEGKSLPASADDLPLNYLVNDIANRDTTVRRTYTKTFKRTCGKLFERLSVNTKNSEATVFSLAALIVGTQAIMQTTDDTRLRKQLLNSCKQQVPLLLIGAPFADIDSYFWEG